MQLALQVIGIALFGSPPPPGRSCDAVLLLSLPSLSYWAGVDALWRRDPEEHVRKRDSVREMDCA